jgi:transposase
MHVDKIRDAVNDELRVRGISRYQLATELESQGVCSRSTIYKWLRGSNDTTTSVASEALDWLNLKVQCPVRIRKIPVR